jgi:hypothetical protein
MLKYGKKLQFDSNKSRVCQRHNPEHGGFFASGVRVNRMRKQVEKPAKP